jgi:hypothetical protein
MDPLLLQTLATWATLALAIGNAIYVLGRSGVSRHDLEGERAARKAEMAEYKRQHDKDFAAYKEESLRGFITYQETQKNDRHEALNREDTRYNRLQISVDECSSDRRKLSERIAKLEK